MRHGLCYMTTMSAAQALVSAIATVQKGKLDVYALQDLPAIQAKAQAR